MPELALPVSLKHQMAQRVSFLRHDNYVLRGGACGSASATSYRFYSRRIIGDVPLLYEKAAEEESQQDKGRRRKATANGRIHENTGPTMRRGVLSVFLFPES